MTIDVPQAPALATRRGVELVQAGQWALSTGVVTFTTSDLAFAVAALDCPAVRRPVLKLGHVDPRFDGEPAVGWVDNVALADSGNTIVGDYVGMPAWLGDVIASAYPDRSIEGCFDFRCQLGHTHPFVLTAVALLGVMAPGVGTLESLQDVAALYGVVNATSDPPGQTVAVTVPAAQEEPAMPNPRPAEVAAGVSSEDVRRAYYENAAYSVWICEMQLDPMQLITVDDESGQYARVPIVLDGDKVTFGEAVPVVIEYVDKPAQAQVAASRLVFASRAESRPEPEPAPAGVPATPQDAIRRVAQASGLTAPTDPPAEPVEPNPTNEGASMALDEGLRERLGLPENADEAEILAALDAKLNDPGPGPASEQDPAETDPAPAAPEPVAASGLRLPDGVVLMDKTELADLRAAADDGRAARAQQRIEARDRDLNDAIQAGKFAPTRRDYWQKLYDADPEGTRTTLASLESGLVPLVDKGAPGSDDEVDTFDAEVAALYPPTANTKG